MCIARFSKNGSARTGTKEIMLKGSFPLYQGERNRFPFLGIFASHHRTTDDLVPTNQLFLGFILASAIQLLLFNYLIFSSLCYILILMMMRCFLLTDFFWMNCLASFIFISCYLQYCAKLPNTFQKLSGCNIPGLLC